MKNKLLLLAVLSVFVLTSNAQSESPIGIYREKKIIDRNGQLIDAPYEQYKICKVNANYQLSMLADKTIADFTLQNISDTPYLFTGKEAQGNLRIYDSNKKQFTLQWLSHYKNHKYFPEDDWCTEFYKTNSFSKDAKSVLGLLKKSSETDKKNPFIGTWVRRGITSEPFTGESIVQLPKDMYKIYGKKSMLIFWGFGSSKVGEKAEGVYSNVNGKLWNVEYSDNPQLLFENGAPVLIHWINSCTFTLTYISADNNAALVEVWDRTDLPSIFTIE